MAENQKQTFEDRLTLGFPNSRRANRIPWCRPIQIISPIQATGKTVNVSAVGILLTLGLDCALQIGSLTSLMLPNVNGRENLMLSGKVVRVERHEHLCRVAVDLIS